MDEYFSDPYVGITRLINRGVAGGGISPSRFDRGIGHVWILSSSDAQPPNIRGKWSDSEEWSDTNVWYD